MILLRNHVSDFLEAFLFASEPESDDPEEFNHELRGRTVYEFAPEIYAGLESFISGFRAYLEARDVSPDGLERSFGANVYFSLSGHGCGFWDDRDDLGREIHEHLVAYSGNKYRFESMNFCNDETGLLDVAFLPEFRKQYRDKLFTL